MRRCLRRERGFRDRTNAFDVYDDKIIPLTTRTNSELSSELFGGGDRKSRLA